MNPTVYAVKKLYGGKKPWGGWAEFKHRLCRAGVIVTPTTDVPALWQQAFLKACGR